MGKYRNPKNYSIKIVVESKLNHTFLLLICPILDTLWINLL